MVHKGRSSMVWLSRKFHGQARWYGRRERLSSSQTRTRCDKVPTYRGALGIKYPEIHLPKIYFPRIPHTAIDNIDRA